MRKYNKIAIVGGGSPFWAPGAVICMANTISMRESSICLMDTDGDRAKRMAATISAVLKRGFPGRAVPCVTGTGELGEALDGADAVYTCYRNIGRDIEQRINAISRRYGSEQACFTAGPGACLYLATQGAVMLDVAHEMSRSCPGAWLINVSNPLPGMSILAVKAGLDPRQVMGLCGTLEGYRENLADFLQVDSDRLAFTIGGTNHCTFYTGVWVDGMDAYEMVRSRAKVQPYLDLGRWGTDTGYVELLDVTGYLGAAGHPDDIYPMLRCERHFREGNRPTLNIWEKKELPDLLNAYGDGKDVDFEFPSELPAHVAWLEALSGAKGVKHRFSMHLPNMGLTPNMPDWAVLDTECELDERGVFPIAVPPLPETIAETARAHQVSFELAARSIIERDRSHMLQAIRMCPFGNYMMTAEKILDDAINELGAAYFF